VGKHCSLGGVSGGPQKWECVLKKVLPKLTKGGKGTRGERQRWKGKSSSVQVVGVAGGFGPNWKNTKGPKRVWKKKDWGWGGRWGESKTWGTVFNDVGKSKRLKKWVFSWVEGGGQGGKNQGWKMAKTAGARRGRTNPVIK